MPRTQRPSSPSGRQIRAFVIAKDEARNIARCLEALGRVGVKTTILLDATSTDQTPLIGSRYPFVEVVEYEFRSHTVAYNEICASLGKGALFALVLDADMVVTEELFAEISELAAKPDTEVIRSPVWMHVEGRPMRFGSNYPPKAFVFKVGREYFVPVGHDGELVGDCVIRQTRAKLIHDDRKLYSEYLNSQYRYSQLLLDRAKTDSLSLRDRLRVRTPLLIFVVPFVSYFLKLGFLSGKAALAYALDRLIAEAVMFRQSLGRRLSDKGEE